MTSAPSFFSSLSTCLSISNAVFPSSSSSSSSSYVECAPCSNVTLKPFLRAPFDVANTQHSLWIPNVTISSTPSALRSAARLGFDSKVSSIHCHVSNGKRTFQSCLPSVFATNLSAGSLFPSRGANTNFQGSVSRISSPPVSGSSSCCTKTSSSGGD